MSECPRCHQPIDVQAIACPHCRLPLKAFGHPGIPLHRAAGEEYLCATCLYHVDDTCNFPQRPYAKECTLYVNSSQQNSITPYKPKRTFLARNWLSRNAVWLVLGTLLLVSILIALMP
ncbi:MAG: zinc ribbon domain-containing protein [Leptolyngbyaceae cyanobacterium RM1_406_9]|nr:zinc ribbon domain-containing protein [Leptolyngbyaceae cyanobacterium RM1_406_9]